MKQSDRIAKLEKEIDFLKDHVTNLHRTFVALVGGNRVQLQQEAPQEQTTVKSHPTEVEVTAATSSSTSLDAPALRRRGVM